MTRIIAGKAKGRRLETPKGDRTRPTSDRVREALFSAIESWAGTLQGLRALDLYAGSGAIGLEAWSRGAEVVTLVESDRRTADLIRRNADTIGCTADVRATAVASVLAAAPAAPYDVVFSDPPYPLLDTDVAHDLLLLVEHGWLATDALVVVERGSRSPEPTWPAGITPLPGKRGMKKYGETRLWYAAAGEVEAPNHYGDGMRRAVCPGSFDPVTNGHLDIFGRAAALFDEVVVAVGVNKSKSASSNRLFTSDERLAMIADAVTPWPNVRVQGFTGLVTAFCREIGAQSIVKGLRGSGDYDYELQMAQMNARLTEVETVFLMTDPSMSFVSSSLVKEVASFGGDVSGFVPPAVFERLTARLAEREAGA